MVCLGVRQMEGSCLSIAMRMQQNEDEPRTLFILYDVIHDFTVCRKNTEGTCNKCNFHKTFHITPKSSKYSVLLTTKYATTNSAHPSSSNSADRGN